MTFIASSIIFSKKKTLVFFEPKFTRVGSGSGLELQLVSKVAFWALLEIISLVVTLEPHVGHTKIPDIYNLSYCL